MSKKNKNKEESHYFEKIELKAKMSFDVYFQGLMQSKRGSILPHHKAPMRKYAENAGLTQATKEEFDEVFRLY